MDMSLLDPSQFCLPAVTNYYLDPILQQAASNMRNSSASAGGKMPSALSTSFRICDLLEISSNTQCSNHSDPSPNSLQSESSISVSPGAVSPNTERSGSPGSSGSKKARKARTIFTDKQLQELENTFDKQKYLSVQDRIELAHRMGLSDTQVKTWYQNRRTKWKRQATTGIDLLSEPGNLAAVQHLMRNNTYWSNYLPNLPNLPMSQLVPMGMSLPMMIPPNQNFTSLPTTTVPFASPTSPETSASSSKNSPPPFNPPSPSTSS